MGAIIIISLFISSAGFILGYQTGYKDGKSESTQIEREKLIKLLDKAVESGRQKERNKIESQSKRYNLN